ncbi:hypothetical protein ABEP16_26190 [Priestia aryabhattai]|uniref:hypothetical protein n=1 Tax=Priestia aryabhattai TaxID=412384 RepID=UPI001FB29566|nr:hypothetical protein [Priestia aryabhattai]
MNKKNIALASIMGIEFFGAAVYIFNLPTEQAEAKDIHPQSTKIYMQQDQGVRSKVVEDYIEENHEVSSQEQLDDMKITSNQFVKNSLDNYSKDLAKQAGVNDEAYNMYLHAKEISGDLHSIFK